MTKFFDYQNAIATLNGQPAAAVELDLNDRERYYLRSSVDEYPREGRYYSTDIEEEVFDRGWNRGRHCFVKWVITPWENTRWGSKEAYDRDHFVPEEADFTQPVEVGIDTFNSIASDYITRQSRPKAFSALETMVKASHLNLCCDGIALTTSSRPDVVKHVTWRYCRSAGGARIYSVKEYDSVDSIKKEYDEKEAAEKKARLDFAHMCTDAARKTGVPFDIALAFKGDEEAIVRFRDTLKAAIKKGGADMHEITCGRARASAEMAKLGIDYGNADPNRVKYYVANCLEKGGIIKQ